jgi:hypothetical protein
MELVYKKLAFLSVQSIMVTNIDSSESSDKVYRYPDKLVFKIMLHSQHFYVRLCKSAFDNSLGFIGKVK